MRDQQRFSYEDLVLKVNPNVDPTKLNIEEYTRFIDALCRTREYQKDAIRALLCYYLGGRYSNISQLAEENYYASESRLPELYRSLHEMKQNLQLPDQLSCSIDLATATGKSYVMYGIATLMLAKGVVDRVLVLCPSLTIERGLTEKFSQLSTDATLKSLLPENSAIRNPTIINATGSIIEGSICIENFHSILEHVKSSSIRASLTGKGSRTLILNDEAHHVFNLTGKDLKRWKEFLLDPEFGFRYIANFSGTCYMGDEYFSDVITRYSLRQAIEQGYAKLIYYVDKDRPGSPYERFQKIYDNHSQNKQQYSLIKPLTILVTRDISTCEFLTEEFMKFLAGWEGISLEEAAKKVLPVTSSSKHRANIRMLKEVDQKDNPVEWITSVSMLTEGWDVENVFQIVPEEERAFNSKLLIAQVLGRGLRVSKVYSGERQIVTVFNHANWSDGIRHLVDQVMEIERKVSSYPINKSTDFNFDLHQIDYSKIPEAESAEKQNEQEPPQDLIPLVSQASTLTRETTYIEAMTGQHKRKETTIRYRMYTVDEVVEHIYNHYNAIDMETDGQTSYAESFSLDSLRNLIRNSLKNVGEHHEVVSAENRQRILAALKVVAPNNAKRLRFKDKLNKIITVNTASRRRNSTGLATLRRGDATVFLDDNSLDNSDEETRSLLAELMKDKRIPRSAYEKVNSFLFKTPLNVVIAEYGPEADFVAYLIKPENAAIIDTWIKSSDQGFYSIEFVWRKGDNPKIGHFNPDFFIKIGNDITVIEIKPDDEVRDPSEENKGKYKAACTHFETLNMQQSEQKYYFHFLTPDDYDRFFQFIRGKNYFYVSALDLALRENIL